MHLQVSGDLLLQGLNVLNKLLTGRLEEEVSVGKPSRVAKADELEKLGEEGESVDGVDDGARQPDGGESSNGVDDESGLVLDLLPLQKIKKMRNKKVREQPRSSGHLGCVGSKKLMR